MKKIIVIIFASLLIFLNCSSKAEQQEKIKTWKVPDYMIENLNYMVNDFNRKFQAKIDSYRNELMSRFKEFKDMPADTILYLEAGVFIKKSDYSKLQAEAMKKQGDKK